MKFQRKKLAGALAYALGVGGAFVVAGAPVQAADIKVDVTGSNIKRVEGEGALPVQVFTREDIQNTGVTTALELMDRLSATQSLGAFNPALGEGSGLVGFSGASLRGLGTPRTLVLINGKRVAPYALSTGNNYSGVDLSQIPLAAVERIEVLKDGASAVYGTDAIAGVINVILRKDFTGAEVGGTFMESEHGGGGARNLHGTVGGGDLAKDKWNAWIAIDYQEQLALRASDREISKSAYIPGLGIDRTSGNTIPANITIPGVAGTKNPGFPNCLPPFSFVTTGSPGQCRFDFAATIDAIPPSQKTNVLGRVTWQINPDHQAYFEGQYMHGDYTQVISPTPVSSAFTINPVLLFPNSPYYPAAYITSFGGDATKPIRLAWRALETGGRSDEVKADAYRAVAGLQGVIKGWDYAVDVNYTSNKQIDSYIGGYLSEAKLLPILASGVINPFGLQTPAGLTALRSAQIFGDASTNKASNYGFNAKISNEVWQLPAGPMALALGAEARKEKLELTNADFLNSGDIIGGLGAIPSLSSANRTAEAVYAELNIPIIKSVEANVAVRWDHYSDFGSTTNPKISVRWQPSKDLLVRGAYGTGFRAPTLFDLDQPIYKTNSNNSFDDPIRCPVTQSVDDCNLQMNSKRGGNATLKAEHSTQYYVGAVWEPSWPITQGWSFGVDYYWIEIKDVITQLAADTIFANFNQYANVVVPGYGGATYVTRKPGIDPNYPNLPNIIDYVVEPTINQGKNGVDGIDIDFTYRAPATVIPATWGKWSAHINGSYIMHYKQFQPGDGSYPNLVGLNGAPQGAISRWRHFATIDWNYGPWGATVAQTFQNGYAEPDLLADDPTTLRRVGSYEIYDLQARYTGIKNVTIAAGIRNVFDRAPPVSGGPGTFQVGYDASYGDPRGRMFYGSLNVAFK